MGAEEEVEALEGKSARRVSGRDRGEAHLSAEVEKIIGRSGWQCTDVTALECAFKVLVTLPESLLNTITCGAHTGASVYGGAVGLGWV